MVTPIWMTGLGPQVVAAASQYQLWNTVTGDVTIDSTTLIGGRPSLRVNSTSLAGARITKVLPGTPSGTMVGRFKVRLAETPDSAQVEALQFIPTTGYGLRIGYNGGKFRARWGSGQTGVVSGQSWVVGSVHLIDVRVNFGVSPMTADWYVDGIAQGQVVDAASQAASTYGSVMFGPPGPDGWLANYTDAMVSATSADFPIGDSTTITLLPSGGTATGAASAFEGTTDTGATYTPVPAGSFNVAQFLNTQPLNGTTKYVRQVAAGAGNYITMPVGDSTASTIRAVRAVVGYGTETAGTSNAAAAAVIRGDGTEVPVFGSSTAPVNYSAGTVGPKFADAIIPPPVAGWTLADVNALQFRFGHATDVSPQPRWYGGLLEVDVATGGGGGAPAAQFLRPNAITASSGTWTGTAANLAETTPDDSTVILSPGNPTNGVYAEVSLTAGIAPGTTAGHIVRYRYALQGPGPMDMTVELRNGSTVVASWVHANISNSFVQADQVLTGAQASALAPYSDIRLRFLPNYTVRPNGPSADLVLTRVDGRTVTADWSNSVEGDSAIASATVAWSDGSNTYTWPTTQTANHQYPATPTGDRTVTVTVSDVNGQTSAVSGVFTVQSATPPTVRITTTRIDTDSATLNITATAGANPLSKVDVTWGDGNSDLNLPPTTTTIRHDYPATPVGFKTITVTATDSAGLTAIANASFEVRAVSGGDIIVYAVGDISAAGTKQTDDQVAALITNAGDMDYVLTPGDLQYPSGLLSDFNTYFDNSFGRFKTGSKILPCPGNHEYDNPGTGAPGYADYFGATLAYPNGAGKFYHHHDVGNWRIICLDSELLPGADGVTTAMRDAQYTWLDARLAEIAGTSKGVLAAWHRPRYCSASTHPSANSTSDLPYQFTSRLVDAHADLIITAHDHVYERFNRMGKTNNVLSTGVRHIVVGTGGCGGTYNVGSVETGSQQRIGFGTAIYGALRLVLSASSYTWEFKRSAGASGTDSGTDTINPK